MGSECGFIFSSHLGAPCGSMLLSAGFHVWIGLGSALTVFFVHHLEPLPLVCIDVHTNIICV